jgi:hypothetical protein
LGADEQSLSLGGLPHAVLQDQGDRLGKNCQPASIAVLIFGGESFELLAEQGFEGGTRVNRREDLGLVLDGRLLLEMKNPLPVLSLACRG